MGTPQVIQFASVGMADSLIIMVLALVVFGPRRLPQIGRQIGKLMYEFRKASNDFKFQMEEELRNAEESDRRKKEEERLKALALAAPAVDPTETAAQAAEPAAAADDATRAASPYPWESVYPSVSAPAAEPQAETTETQPDGTGLQILAPSSGETVAAARPKRVRRKRTPEPPVTGDTVGAAPAGAPSTEPEFHSAAEQAWKEEAEAVAPRTEAIGAQIQPPEAGEMVAAAPPKRTRRKQALKPPDAENITAATEQPLFPETNKTDVPAPEKSGTVPEQVNG